MKWFREECAMTNEKNSKWQNISENPGTLSHLVKRFTGEKHYKGEKNALINIKEKGFALAKPESNSDTLR